MTDQLAGYELSPRQRRLWALAQGGQHGWVQLTAELEGPISTAAFRAAVARVGESYPILGTSFRKVQGALWPLQVEAGRAAEVRVLEPAPELDRRDRRLEVARQDELRAPDYEHGPLLSWTLIPQGDTAADLVITASALLADAASLEVLLKHLAAELAGVASNAAGEEALPFLQFAAWHNEVLRDPDSASRLRFWEEWVSGQRWRFPLALAAGGSAESPSITSSSRRRVSAPPDLASWLAGLGAEPGDFWLAAWAVLLMRLGVGSEVVITTVLPGRLFDEVGASVGPFALVLPLRFQMEPGWVCRDLVRRARQLRLDAASNQELFETQPGPMGEPQAVPTLLVEVAPALGSGTVGGLTWRGVARAGAVEAGELFLRVVPLEGGFDLEISAAVELVDAELPDRLTRRLAALAADAFSRPEAELSTLGYLDEAERLELTHGVNPRREVSPPRGVHELFAIQARRDPGRLAVIAGERRWSYGELLAAADRLARELVARGIGAEDLVAIVDARRPEVLAGILGILRAGAAFLPLDPTHPPDRLRRLVAESRPRVFFTLRQVAWQPEQADLAVVELDGAFDPAAEPLSSDALPEVPVEALAYVLFTSGSTGTPKGVMVPHRALSGYLQWAADIYRLGEGCTPVHSPLSFDLTLTVLLGPLLAGGSVELLDVAEPLSGLWSRMQQSETGAVKLTPAHLEILGLDVTRAQGLGADTLIVGGEALYGEALAPWRRLKPELRVINEYGPTEATVGCALYELPSGEVAGGPVPIGRPVPGAVIYVLDNTLELVGAEVCGELYVGGTGVARGYLHHPAQTAERFVPDPFSGVPGARLYRTGDLADRRHGELRFRGRADHQIKYRGFRIELGEIEAALRELPGVTEAVAAVHEDQGDRVLVAYFTASREVGGGEALRQALRQRLPDFMLPAEFLQLAVFPLTSNGKVDRSALPAPSKLKAHRGQTYEPPANRIEEILVEVWQKSLRVEKVGAHDNFFVLGGDSMRSVRLVALAREQGLEFAVQDLFRAPTVRQLAEWLAANGSAPAAVAVEAEASDLSADELASLLEEIEGLSDEEVKERLHRGAEIS